MKLSTRDIVQQAIIAGLYRALTILLPAPTYGPLQFRLSEVMTLLAFYNSKNIIGLTVGCFISNIPSPLGIYDMFFGTLGTFLAVYLMSKSKNIYIASIWPTVFSFIYGLENAILTNQIGSSVVFTIQIMVSQFIIVSIIGVILFKILEKNEKVYAFLTDKTI